jgi:hypothetical protein
MTNDPKTPMTEMHDFLISTKDELINEIKSSQTLKLVSILEELNKITEELLSYEKKYIDMIKAEGMQEGINVAKKIFDNTLNKPKDDNFFTACIN